MYISKQDFANIERATSNKKLLMCKGIAKFYIRIAHLFAAIATTVSPNWSASSSGQFSSGVGAAAATSGATSGATAGPRPPAEGAPQPDDRQMPKRGGQNANANASNDTDLCSVRIRALLGATKTQANGDMMIVQPTVCSLYASSENPLLRQPGMPDLGHLYNDIYDAETGRFSGRSIAMQNLYDSDLKKLYVAFTGDSDMPANVKTFGDISIPSLTRYKECGPVVQTAKPAPVKEDPTVYRDKYGNRVASLEWREKLYQDKAREIQNEANTREYYKSERENYSGIFTTQFKVAKNSGAYINYGTHIKQMILNADRARENLMQIIDKLFLIVQDPSGKKNPIITIHPNLTYEVLDALINQTREMIIKLYVGCERDFYTGLGLLHVIIEEIMNANMNARLNALKSSTYNNIKKLEEDAMRAKARSGSSKIYNTDNTDLLSTGDSIRFEEYELHSQKDAQDTKDEEKHEELLKQANDNAEANSRPAGPIIPDAPAVAPAVAPAGPVIPAAAGPAGIPAAPDPAGSVIPDDPPINPMIRNFNPADEVVPNFDIAKIPKKSILKRSDSPKKEGRIIKFKGGRHI
jgi:hypothetical protein